MDNPIQPLITRRIQAQILELLHDEPVIAITGPRTVGKSTLLKALSQDLQAEFIDLDDPGTRTIVAGDLAGFTQADSTVLIDEFQLLPQLLDSIKSRLNAATKPGMFVMAGSTRYSLLPQAAQSLTGRVHVVNAFPLSQGEIAGVQENFAETALIDPLQIITQTHSPLERHQFYESVLRGGFPMALQRVSQVSQGRWFRNYIDLTINRDVLDIRKVKQREILPILLRNLMSHTAQILNITDVSKKSSLSKTTTEDFIQLLESVFLIHRLPAWGNTLASRVNKTPKIHAVDSGVASWLLGINQEKLKRRIPHVITEFGRICETYVVNEIMKQISWLDYPLHLGHYRSHDDYEVDLVIENSDNTVIGIEIKSGSTYRDDDMKGLRHLQRRLGDQFLAGFCIYLGDRAAKVGEKLYLIPINKIWQRY